MAETLSQEEIDALREAVADGDVIDGDDAQGAKDDQVKVAAYDFRKPRIVSGEQQSVLRMVHESMAKDMQSWFVTALKMLIEVKVVAMDEITYSEYVLSLTNPTYVALFSANPSFGECAVQMSTNIVSTILDVLLGGEGDGGYDTSRELTPLEVNIFRGVIAEFFRELRDAWLGTCDVSFDLISEESNPEYAQLTTPETPCLVITFDVHAGESEGVFTVCYPFSVIQLLFARASGKGRGDAPGQARESNHRALKAIEDVPLDLHAVVGNGTVSAGELGCLRAGDVLCLDRRYDEALDVYVGANLAYRARAARRHGLAALDLTQVCCDCDSERTKDAPATDASQEQGNSHG